MTLHHPVGGALTGPADQRHIPQTLDRITGISAVLLDPAVGAHLTKRSGSRVSVSTLGE